MRKVRIFSVFRQSCSLFSASLQTFCLSVRASLNTQKYGLSCSLLCHEIYQNSKRRNCKRTEGNIKMTTQRKEGIKKKEWMKKTWKLKRTIFQTSFLLFATFDRAIFAWTWKMVSVSVRYLFYQPVDEKIKTWPLRFPAKENPNVEKALFVGQIVLQYDVKAKYRMISRKFSRMKFFHPSVPFTNQKPRAFVSVR